MRALCASIAVAWAMGIAGRASAAPARPIEIGVMVDCRGTFGFAWEMSLGGAMLPLIERGALPAGTLPSAGVIGATVAGRPVHVLTACSADAAQPTVGRARALLAQGVDILIGPTSGDAGVALAEESKRHGATFINGTSASLETTLNVGSERFFSWTTNGAQWSAGLAPYVHDVLGWQRVAIVGDDYSFPYTLAAGFVAELCQVGGDVVARAWPPLGTVDFGPVVEAILATEPDGIYLALGPEATFGFVGALLAAKADDPDFRLADTLTGGLFLGFALPWLGPAASGVVLSLGLSPGWGYPDPGPAWPAYLESFAAAYPALGPIAGDGFVFAYYLAMEATLQALEQIDGDLSDGHERLHQALRELTLASPVGDIRLDAFQNAVGPNFLYRIGANDGNEDGAMDLEYFSRIDGVEQTFGGFLAAGSEIGRDSPACP